MFEFMTQVKDQFKSIWKHSDICFDNVRKSLPDKTSLQNRLFVLTNLVQYCNKQMRKQSNVTEAELIDDNWNTLENSEQGTFNRVSNFFLIKPSHRQKEVIEFLEKAYIFKDASICALNGMKYEIDEFMLEDKKEELECDAEDLWKLAYKNLETKVE